MADELTSACIDQKTWDSTRLEAPSVPNARPSVVVVGSSTAQGFGASIPDSGYVWRLASLLQHRKPGECLTNLGEAGFTTFDVRSSSLPVGKGQTSPDSSRNIDEALRLRPALVIIHLPTNDAADTIPFETSRTNLLETIRRADSAGSRVLLLGAQPRVNLDSAQFSLLRVWSRFLDTLSAVEVVRVWDSVAQDSAHLKTQLANSDGIHLNDTGHAILFRAVVRSRTWQSIVPGSWNPTDSLPVCTVDSFSMPRAGRYIQGQNLDFTATFSHPVLVKDTPSIRLTVGGKYAFAKYDSGTGTSRIRFRYTVQAADRDSNGILVARWIDSTGGTLADSPGHPVATNIVSVDPLDTIRIVANRPPTLLAPFPDTSLKDDSSVPLVYNLGEHFTDSDGSVIVYHIRADTSVVQCQLYHDTLRIRSRPDTSGKSSIIVSALDNLGASVSDTFVVTVVHVNDPPTVVNPIHDTTVLQDFSTAIVLALTSRFHDSDGIIASVHVFGDSSIIRYALSHDTLRISSRPKAYGRDSLVVSATDDSGASVSDTFVVTVVHVNDPPTVVNPIHDTTVLQDFSTPVVLALTSRFHDSDGIIASVHVFGDSSTIRYALSHDTLRISSRPKAYGKDSLVVSATDDSGASVSDTFVVDVTKNTTTSLKPMSRPGSDLPSNGMAIDLEVLAPLVDQIPSATGVSDPQLGPASRGTCARIEGCSSLGMKFNGPGNLWVSIFDNIGVPVLAGNWRIGGLELNRMRRDPTGKPADNLLWNQTDSRGVSVSTGVYIWRVVYQPDSGEKVEAVFRLGIRPERVR